MSKVQNTMSHSPVSTNQSGSKANELELISTIDQLIAIRATTPITVAKESDFAPEGVLHRENLKFTGQYDPFGALQDAMQREGQENPIEAIRKADGLHVPIGNVRLTAFRRAGKAGWVFKAGPYTGKLMSDHIRVKILPPMTPEVEARLRSDDANVVSYTKFNLGQSFDKMISAGVPEARVILDNAVRLVGLYPAPSKGESVKPITEDGGKSFAKAYHSTYQLFDYANRGPTVLKNAFYAKLAGGNKRPSDGDVRKYGGAAIKEIQDDKTGKLNRDNPGPNFLEWWQRESAEIATAKETGGKVKATSMETADAIGKRIGIMKSKTFKAVYANVLRREEGAIQFVMILDELIAAFEKKDKAMLAAFEKRDAGLAEAQTERDKKIAEAAAKGSEVK